MKELTKNDFDVIIEGLQLLAKKGDAGSLFGGFIKSISKSAPPHIKKDFEELEKKELKKATEIKEKSFITLGKVVNLKRELFPEY